MTEETQQLVALVEAALGQLEPKCIRCGDMGGYFVGPPDGIRMFVGCPECRGKR